MSDGRTNVQRRADEILAQRLRQIRGQTDRIFAVLFGLQWIFVVGCALTISPRTWIATEFAHAHVWALIVLGGALALCPIVFAIVRPGAAVTRWVVTIAQMLYSALMVHLMGGRTEALFHVFGSLALLTFYRDCRLFIPATMIVFADNLLRGFFWPESGFGVLLLTTWRAFEHTGWVLFEEVFLIWGCITGTRELRAVAQTQAELEEANLVVEQRVERRTHELEARGRQLEAEIIRRQNLELQLLQAQKLESIGQLAAGIAHEINTPMQFVSDNIEFLSDCSKRLFEVVDAYQDNLFTDGQQKSWAERKQNLMDMIERNRFDAIRTQFPQAITESLEGIQRVIHIVRAMKEFSHPGHEQKVGVDLNNAVRSTVTIARNRWKYVAELELDLDPDLPTLNCVPADINQVLLNLIVNAADAIAEKVGSEGHEKGLITVRTGTDGENVVIEVEDTGCGIPNEIRYRIFDPFFTTKDVGQGTGQGLAICYNVVVNKHHGTIDVLTAVGEGTVFRIALPRKGAGPNDYAANQEQTIAACEPALA